MGSDSRLTRGGQPSELALKPRTVWAPPKLLCTLEGPPTVYLTEGGVFTGPQRLGDRFPQFSCVVGSWHQVDHYFSARTSITLGDFRQLAEVLVPAGSFAVILFPPCRALGCEWSGVSQFVAGLYSIMRALGLVRFTCFPEKKHPAPKKSETYRNEPCTKASLVFKERV